MTAASNENEKPEVKAQEDAMHFLHLQSSFRGVVGQQAPLYEPLFLPGVESKPNPVRTDGKEEQDDKGEGTGHDTLDQEDPSPGPPAIGAI